MGKIRLRGVSVEPGRQDRREGIDISEQGMGAAGLLGAIGDSTSVEIIG